MSSCTLDKDGRGPCGTVPVFCPRYETCTQAGAARSAMRGKTLAADAAKTKKE